MRQKVSKWLHTLQDVHRGLADAFEMKFTYAGPKTGNNEVEYLERRIDFTDNGLEIHGDPKHSAIVLKQIEKEMCKSVNSLHVLDVKLLETLHRWCRVQGRVALSTGEAELYAQI